MEPGLRAVSAAGSSAGGGQAADGPEAISLDPHDGRLDAITALAVEVGGGDIGGISIVHRSRLWLPSRLGIAEALLPRAGTFCSWVVDHDLTWFEVEDARKDERFASNPLVAGKPGYAHYAAMSLATCNGNLRATLWTMSMRPRRLSDAQIVRLRALAGLTAEMLQLRYCDAASGLLNREAFLRQLQAIVEQSAQPRLLVACVELAGFSALDGQLGRGVGEGILRAVAGCLEARGGEQALLGHVGPGLFAIALLDDGQDTVDFAALRAAVEHLVTTMSGSHRTTVHVGIRCEPVTPDLDLEQVLEAAGFVAAAGPGETGAVRLFDRMVFIRSRLRYQLHEALRKDAGVGALVVHYQPQVDLDSGGVIGMEALVRWDHPELGLLGPGQFVPQAEARGEIFQLDMHVMRAVCEDLRAWREAGLQPPPVALNFSRTSLRHPAFADRVAQVLSDTGVPGPLLEFEITESALAESHKPLHDPIHALRSLGVRIAVDDFGTGLSNLDALNSFHFDRLKVDRQFVHGVASNPRVAGLFTLIQGIAEIFGAELLCEGLEEECDLRWLEARGVRKVQGWYFCKALAHAEVSQLLERIAADGRAARGLEELRALLRFH